MKRLFAILLLSAMLLATACSQPVELLPFIDANSEGLDLDGVEINWLWHWGSRTTPSYKIGTPQYDALIARVAEIEEKYGCDIIENIPTGDEDIDDKRENLPNDRETMYIQLMSGTFKFDILFANMDSEEFKMGYFYSMEDLSDYIDWTDSEKFGNRGLLEAGMYNGVPYVVYPNNWPGFDGVEMCVAAYNRDLYKQYQLTDPQEFYEQGTWTYDTFVNELLAKVEISKAGDDEAQIYAFQTDEPDFYQCLIASNNVQFVKKNDDGTLTADPYPQSFVNAITWGQEIMNDYRDIILYDSDTYSVEEYCRGEVFMGWLPSNTVTTGAIAYNTEAVFDSGVMPLPCGPDATYGEWGQLVQDVMGFCVPITSVKAEAAAVVINELCEALPGYEDPLAFYDMTFSNPLDTEIFLQLGKNTRFDYTRVDNDLGRTIGENFGDIATEPHKSLSEAMEKYRSLMTSLIENWMLPNYETVHAED